MRTVTLHSIIDTPWLEMPPVQIGYVPAGLGTPDVYALVSEGEHPLARIDFYQHPDEYHAFEAATVWFKYVVIGAGHRVHFVELQNKRTIQFDLGAYFGSMEVANEQLLVASAERVFCFGGDGLLKWKSVELGIDGVVIHSVTETEIRGAGEWDPPGGWESFCLSATTGKLVTHAA